MGSELNIGKTGRGLLWIGFQALLFVMNVVHSPNKRVSRYSVFEVADLLEKGEISIQEHNQVMYGE